MVILGIDPGYATVGFGVVDYAYGKFTPIRFGAIKMCIRDRGKYLRTNLLDSREERPHGTVCNRR